MGHSFFMPRKNRISLSEQDMQLLIENTNLTRKQINELYDSFLEDCPTGLINRKKFTFLFKRHYPTGHVDNFCRFLFQAFDYDKKGTIDFVEFMVVMCLMLYGEPKEKLKLFFDVYDIDKNGSIAEAELEEIVKALYDFFGEENRRGENAPMKRVEKIMLLLDTDNDHYISKEEFIEGCLKDKTLMKMLAPTIKPAFSPVPRNSPPNHGTFRRI
ncbi:hypothetical protein ACOME3_007816 [Neoechinorhynchus agilis]